MIVNKEGRKKKGEKNGASRKLAELNVRKGTNKKLVVIIMKLCRFDSLGVQLR